MNSEDNDSYFFNIWAQGSDNVRDVNDKKHFQYAFQCFIPLVVPYQAYNNPYGALSLCFKDNVLPFMVNMASPYDIEDAFNYQLYSFIINQLPAIRKDYKGFITGYYISLMDNDKQDKEKRVVEHQNKKVKQILEKYSSSDFPH